MAEFQENPTREIKKKVVDPYSVTEKVLPVVGKLSDYVGLEDLRAASKYHQRFRFGDPPEAWVELLRELPAQERSYAMSAVGDLVRRGYDTLGDVREVDAEDMEGKLPDAYKEISPERAVWLKSTFGTRYTDESSS